MDAFVRFTRTSSHCCTDIQGVPKSYAAATRRRKTQHLPHLLCVHQGTKELIYTDEELFSRVIDAMEKMVLVVKF